MRLNRITFLVVTCLFVFLSCISGQDLCPDGYGSSFNNSCYKFVSKIEDQNQAASECAADEAHLADIKSEEEQQFIVNWLKTNTNKDVWIGLSKQGTDDYVWTDGSPVEYDAWAPDEPNNNKNCVRLRNEFGYLWDDRQCNQDNPFICEIEALGCPPGWHFHNRSCYFVDGRQDMFTYNEARKACIEKNATLSSINNQDEQYFHNRLATLYGNLWIGLNDKATEGIWKWEDASPYNFTNWAPNEPNDSGGNEDCAYLREGYSGQWNDEECGKKYGYICKMYLGCPAGWHFHKQFCYFVDGQQLKTYDQARIACKEMNATLSSINDQDEQYFQNRFATLYDNLWIGLNDKDNEGTWQWEDKSTYNFTNWASGEPNDSGGEDCAHLWEVRSGFKWNDNKCKTKYGYTCKMPSAIPELTTTAPTTAAMTTSLLTSPVNGTTPVATTAPTSGSTRTIPANRTDIGGTPNPQSDLSPGAIAGAVIGSILLLLLILLILFLIASRPRHKMQTKSGKSTTLAFDGPYDLTIEGKSNFKPQNTEQPIYTEADGDNKQKQPIYTDADDDNKQQPIYANSTSTKPATEVYQSIGESSTDNNTAPVYVDIDPNNDAPNSNNVSVTGDQGSCQETSLYYAKSDSNQDANGAPITAVQESCQEGSLYYAKSDSHPATNGDLTQESSTANTSAGWEDNAAYSSFEDGELVHDQDNLGGQQEQEGWEDNGLYSGNGINGNDEDEEEWKDNSIYAGSDSE